MCGCARTYSQVEVISDAVDLSLGFRLPPKAFYDSRGRDLARLSVEQVKVRPDTMCVCVCVCVCRVRARDRWESLNVGREETERRCVCMCVCVCVQVQCRAWLSVCGPAYAKEFLSESHTHTHTHTHVKQKHAHWAYHWSLLYDRAYLMHLYPCELCVCVCVCVFGPCSARAASPHV